MSTGALGDQEEEFTEFEIRTASNDIRSYYTSKFRASSDLKDINLGGNKGFVPPFFVKFAEIVNPAQEAADQDEDLPVTDNFKRIRRWRHRKEYEWKLYDNKKDELNTFKGRKITNTLQYVALVPPSSSGGAFRMVKIHDMFNFEKTATVKALTIDQIEKFESKKVKFGSSLLEAAMKESGEGKGWMKLEKSRKTKNAFETDEDAVESSMKTDVGSLAIDRIAADKAGESFADFDDNFSDDEDDTKEIKDMTAQVEEEIDPVLSEGEASSNDEEEADLDKLENAVDKTNYESDEEIRATNTQANVEEVAEPQPPQDESQVPNEKKTVRKLFTESLLNNNSTTTSQKRKLEKPESEAVKKQKVLGDLERNLVDILKAAGGKMLTKELVKAAKAANLIQEKEKFKNALAEIGALETVNGQKMVVLKREHLN